MKTLISIRIDSNIFEQLKTIAIKENRSLGYLINQILTNEFKPLKNVVDSCLPVKTIIEQPIKDIELYRQPNNVKLGNYQKKDGYYILNINNVCYKCLDKGTLSGVTYEPVGLIGLIKDIEK